MEIKHIPLDKLRPASWCVNVMTTEQLAKLKRSIRDFGVVENLVVRSRTDGTFQVIGGNQRLTLYQQLQIETIPCVVVDLPDGKARLLSQILNRLHGEDDQGRKAALVEEILAEVDKQELLDHLPDTEPEINALLAMRHSTLKDAFTHWEEKLTLGLHVFQVVLSEEDYEVVNRAVAHATKVVRADAQGTNLRAMAVAHICGVYLESETTTKAS